MGAPSLPSRQNSSKSDKSLYLNQVVVFFAIFFVGGGSDFEDVREVQIRYRRPVALGIGCPSYLLDEKLWGNATPIRTIFREALIRADLPNFTSQLQK